jgi:hypothetical protein
MELECPLSLLAPFKLPALRPPKSFLDCQQVVQREMVRKLLEVIAEAVGSKQEWAGEVGAGSLTDMLLVW